jgi:hypothetical protein
MSADIRVRRVYEEPSAADGARILVDRIWPRGLRKDAARLDEWAKDVALANYGPGTGTTRPSSMNSSDVTSLNWSSPERGRAWPGSAH